MSTLPITLHMVYMQLKCGGKKILI